MNITVEYVTPTYDEEKLSLLEVSRWIVSNISEKGSSEKVRIANNNTRKEKHND